MRRLIIAALATLVLAAGTAWAHNTGQEARTPAACSKLPGTPTTGMRGACLRCITRPARNHYHPENPKGKRCRPDNGQP